MTGISRRPTAHRPFWAVVAVAGAVLLLLQGWWSWRERERAPRPGALRSQFVVEGLDCPVWCAIRLEQGLELLPGVEVETIDLGAGTVVARHDERQSRAALAEQLAEHGFPVLASGPVSAPAK